MGELTRARAAVLWRLSRRPREMGIANRGADVFLDYTSSFSSRETSDHLYGEGAPIAPRITASAVDVLPILLVAPNDLTPPKQAPLVP